METPKSAITRRSLLRKAAGTSLAFAVPTIIPQSVFAAPPSEKIMLGFVGMGGMGMNHLMSLKDQAVAVCDVDENRMHGARFQLGPKAYAFKDYRSLLERKDIDAIIIATPDHWHTLVSLHAMQAGKDVYCEKPLTLTVAEGQALVKAARRYGAVFQTGTQQRSSREFYHACMLVRNNYIGKLERIDVGLGGNPTCDDSGDGPAPHWIDWDMWLGQAPWVPYNSRRHPGAFRFIWDYSGGSLCDWGAHHLDIAQWGHGTDLTGPVEIDGKGELPTTGVWNTPTTYVVNYKYADGVTITAGPGRPSGVTFYGSKGKVYVDRGTLATEPEELERVKFGADSVQLYESPNIDRGWTGSWVKPSHYHDWFDCIKTRRKCVCDVEIGHRSITLSHLGNLSIRLGRKLNWDPDKEQFVGDEEANRWLSRPMRKPWHL
ncbi:MAG TPA: Gfo/Idh/MocA family oxidoreductase [Candidatus Brocadiia bacterium]|nr:Gfo/Idh/MocA family oxidoreductase [Candidatus Brocadiia bacterium]